VPRGPGGGPGSHLSSAGRTPPKLPADCGCRAPLPQERPPRYLAEKFVLARNASEWLRERVVKHGMRAPLVLDAQLRLGNERGVGRGAEEV
jgi:hypothetical protein